jgi:restriction system protein
MPRVPQSEELMWPTLTAMRDLGGSATIRELDEKVIQLESFSEEIQAAPHGEDGRQTELEYRLAWARTYLRGIGAITNSSRGVWAVTEHGRTLTADEVTVAARDWKAAKAAERRNQRVAGNGPESEPDDDESSWKDELTARMLQLEAGAFERLAQRLLREAGFLNVSVTGRSGDGGIDGVGVYRVSLVSFPTFFQCKRYRGSVPAGAVRDFRGAMAGRGEKGLLITTGTFTREATAEATRDGAPPIELIDGDRLCDLLKEYGLGVTTKQRVVEDVRVEYSFFDDLD